MLHRVQQTFGYIPRAVAFEVAELLEVPLAKIYGVITFYNFFKLKRPGRNQIQVCLGTACYLRGGEDIVREIEKQLGVGLNAITPDGEFSFEAVRCLGCCGLAPVMTINGKVYGKLEAARLPAILAKYTDRFPKVDFLNVEKTFGDWRTVQKTHFNDGGVFDQIYPAK